MLSHIKSSEFHIGMASMACMGHKLILWAVFSQPWVLEQSGNLQSLL